MSIGAYIDTYIGIGTTLLIWLPNVVFVWQSAMHVAKWATLPG